MTVCYKKYFVIISDITSVLKETPTKYELNSVLFNVSDKWYDIGLSLQVYHNVLDDLIQSERDDKLLAVIDNFLTTEPSPVTWETVITAIESPIVNDKETADLIRHYLSTGKSIKLLLLSNEVIKLLLLSSEVVFRLFL